MINWFYFKYDSSLELRANNKSVSVHLYSRDSNFHFLPDPGRHKASYRRFEDVWYKISDVLKASGNGV